LASGIRVNCFLSVIGTDEHDEMPNDMQPQPKTCKNNLLSIYIIYMIYSI